MTKWLAYFKKIFKQTPIFLLQNFNLIPSLLNFKFYRHTKKGRRLKQAVKDLFVFFLIGGFSRFAQVLILPFVAVQLGPADFGVFSLLLLYLTLGSALLLMGLDQALFRFIPQLSTTQLYRYAGTAFNFLLLLFIFWLPWFISFDSFLNRLLFNGQFNAPVLLLLIFTFLIALNTLILSKIKAQKHTTIYFTFMFLRTFLFVSLFVIFLFFKLKLTAYFIALSVSELVVLLYQSPFVVRAIFAGFNRAFLKQLLKYGLPLAVSGFLLILLYQFDHYLLKVYFGVQAPGIYNFAYKFAAVIGTLILIANNVWMPRLFEKDASFGRIYLKYYATFLLLLAAWVLGGILSVFSLFNQILIPTGFETTPKLILIIGVGYLFFSHSQILDSIILKEKKSKLLMFVMLIILSLNIILNLIFIPMYGLHAAAWTTTISMMVLWFLTNALVHRLQPDLSLMPVNRNFLALCLPFLVLIFYHNFFLFWGGLFVITFLLLKSARPLLKQFAQNILVNER